jgi:hypothetical protein
VVTPMATGATTRVLATSATNEIGGSASAGNGSGVDELANFGRLYKMNLNPQKNL